MSYEMTPRFGLVVPPENPTAEPEFTALFGARINLYTSRFPVTPGMSLRPMLDTYNEVLPSVLGGFGRLRLDAGLIACSASHYLLSPAGDRATCRALTEQAGAPIVSSPQAILAACAALDLERLVLVSPYEPWLTDLSRTYWDQAGLAVDHVLQVRSTDDGYDPYRVTTRELVDQVRAADLPDDATLLFTGTGMRTLDAFAELGADGRVLLSSNLAGAWWALRSTGACPEEPDDHALFTRLASVRLTPAGTVPA